MAANPCIIDEHHHWPTADRLLDGPSASPLGQVGDDWLDGRADVSQLTGERCKPVLASRSDDQVIAVTSSEPRQLSPDP
jgi:hypothetical protein